MCLDTALNDLKYFANQIGADKVLILTDYSNSRNLLVFKQINNLTNIMVFNLHGKNLGLTFEKFNKPFYFILNEDFSYQMFFIHEILLPNLTRKYLNEVKNIFLL